MADPLSMKVLERLYHLLKVEPGDLLRQSTSLGNVVEELPVLHELQNNAKNILSSAISLSLLICLQKIDKFDNVGMVYMSKNLYFGFDEIEEGLRDLFPSTHYLHCS